MVSSVASHYSISRLLDSHSAVVSRGGPRRWRFFLWVLITVVVVSVMLLVMKPEGVVKRISYHSILEVAEQRQASTATPREEVLSDIEGLMSKQDSSKGFLVFTSGCKIPDLDPMDPAVRKYIKFYALDSDDQSNKEDSEKVHPDCSGKFGPILVRSNLTSLLLVTSALAHYNVTDPSNIRCCYRPFHRVMADPINYTTKCDDLSEYSKDCVPFGIDGTVSVGEEEFVRVECRNASGDQNASPIYKDFHFFTPVKLARKRAEEQRKEMNFTEATEAPKSDKWNVIVLGPDAVSRLNFHRQMPKTKEVLEKMGAIELLGYNKIADNTFPNLVALFTGYTEDELKQICWPKSEIKLDDCPWIWYNFTAAGYLTALAEDTAWMSTFNYAKAGFLKQPVHFYHRPLVKKAEDENGHLKRMNAKLCVGPRLAVQEIIGYLEKIMYSMKLDTDPPPLFGHFWTNSLSHDYLNSVGYLDDPMSELLERLRDSGVLERTVLVFLSDHGVRWGGIRSTYQGKIEERLPIAYVSLPPSMREKYPSAAANLRRNAMKRLTSPFDIHATMLDIINPEERMTPEALARRTKELPNSPPKGNETSELPRSMSLFLPIPEWRTCNISGITPNWCCCHAGEKNMDADDPLVMEAADVLMERVNELVEVYPQCAKRNLVGVKSAIMSTPPETLLPDKDKKILQDLSLVVESNPGSALFEATVRMLPIGERGTTTYEMKVLGTVSRINRYGHQSACVDEYHAKLYCYCGF